MSVVNISKISQTEREVKQSEPLPIWIMFLSAGIASCWSEICTLPLDTAKVRLQVQWQGGQQMRYTGVTNCLQIIVKEEGILSVWAGLPAGLQRQIVFGTIRLSLYQPVKNFYSNGSQETSLFLKIITAFTTGTIAMMVANPTDLVKIRLQGQGIQRLIDPFKIRYLGVFDAYKKIYKLEGLLAFWTGILPNCTRNAIINAAELSSFDQIKETIIKYKLLEDSVPCHLISSACAGFIATVVGSPIDVVKTRIMNADKGKYFGIFDCIRRTYREEGFWAFYSGFKANAQRIMSFNIMMWTTWQQMQKIARKSLYPHEF